MNTIPITPGPIRLTRSRRIRRACGFSLVLAFASATVQADPGVNAALESASRYLLSEQAADGSIGQKYPMANTSLAVLALAACGHQPGDATAAGQGMSKAIGYVLLPANQTADGYFGKADNSRMYGHGITTLMLAEMLGMGADGKQDAAIRTKCTLGVELILRAQSIRKDPRNAGGWRYEPTSGDSDLSATVWQTMALRAAQNAGVDVPREAIDKVVGYMKGLYKPFGENGGPGTPGGFGYSGPGHELSTTAEGLLAMQVCGQYQAEETLGAADLLLQQEPKKEAKWFYYTVYYYAQGMYQRGGRHAGAARRVVPALLLPLQSREGWFPGAGGNEADAAGLTYTTSLAVLSLAVTNHFLPIYQR
ncbi:MAG: hypothetical protein O3A92_10365 [Verrucomicrobia bacterium]|nr:hypothetical protein [Verrucomicrobiota bacterium]